MKQAMFGLILFLTTAQDAMIPNEYRYFKRFDELLPENNHLIAVVIFKTQLDKTGNYVPNNFVVTGWANYIVPKG